MASSSLMKPQSLNLYAYCENDPINQTDPDGLDGIDADGIIRVSTTIWGGGYGSGAGRSIPSGWSNFLTGLFGSLFGRGNRNGIINLGPINFVNMQSTTATFGLPGMGTETKVDETLVQKSATDCSGDGAVSVFNYINGSLSNAWDQAMDAVNLVMGFIGFTEMFRSNSHQQSLYDAKYGMYAKAKDLFKYQKWDPNAEDLPVAYPGSSSHEAGFSFDLPKSLVDQTTGRAAQLEEILNKFGWHRNIMDPHPYGNDTVHFTHKNWDLYSPRQQKEVIEKVQNFWNSNGGASNAPGKGPGSSGERCKNN